MKTLALFILFSGFCLFSSAQTYAIINDKDGSVNIRKDRGTTSPIVGKINTDDVFACDDDEDKSDWIKIYKLDWGTENEFATEGYVHKSRVFPLSKFKSVKNFRLLKDSCIATNDSLTVIIKSKSFNPKIHKLTYNQPISKANAHPILVKIDNRHIWGTDGNLPKRIISDVKIVKNGMSVVIPEEAFNDLYEPQFRSLQVYLGKNDTIYIEMDNSDGAGGYSIIWIIKNGQYLRRYVDNSFA
jgi:hypothetical protein